MEPELRELLEKQAIAELLYAYAEGIERCDGKLLETVFTEDCHLHYGAYDQPARVLVDSWRGDRTPMFLMTHHLYGNIVVRFFGAGRRSGLVGSAPPARIKNSAPVSSRAAISRDWQ